MPAGNTYEAIATQTLGSATTSVTFSSISGSYTDLILVINATAAGNEQVALRMNNDSGLSYSTTVLFGNGSSAGSGRTLRSESGNTGMLLDWFFGLTSSTPATLIVNVMNYANTTTNKTALIRTSNAATGTAAIVGMWNSTSAINRLDVVSRNGSNFSVGSTFSLYGIASA
jgi:hypothetical protein